MPFQELSPDEITSLRATTRVVGAYRQLMTEFLNSGVEGADVTASFPGRKPGSVAQALKKLSKSPDFDGKVTVYHVTRDGNETVALVRTAASATAV